MELRFAVNMLAIWVDFVNYFFLSSKSSEWAWDAGGSDGKNLLSINWIELVLSFMHIEFFIDITSLLSWETLDFFVRSLSNLIYITISIDIAVSLDSIEGEQRLSSKAALIWDWRTIKNLDQTSSTSSEFRINQINNLSGRISQSMSLD